MKNNNPNMLPDDALDAVAGGFGFGEASINEGDYVQALYNGQWQQARIVGIRLTPDFDLKYSLEFGYFADGGGFVVTGTGEVEAGNITV